MRRDDRRGGCGSIRIRRKSSKTPPSFPSSARAKGVFTPDPPPALVVAVVVFATAKATTAVAHTAAPTARHLDDDDDDFFVPPMIVNEEENFFGPRPRPPPSKVCVSSSSSSSSLLGDDVNDDDDIIIIVGVGVGFGGGPVARARAFASSLTRNGIQESARPVQFRVLTPTLKLFETTFWDTLLLFLSLSLKKSRCSPSIRKKKETPPLFTFIPFVVRGGVD